MYEFSQATAHLTEKQKSKSHNIQGACHISLCSVSEMAMGLEL